MVSELTIYLDPNIVGLSWSTQHNADSGDAGPERSDVDNYNGRDDLRAALAEIDEWIVSVDRSMSSSDGTLCVVEVNAADLGKVCAALNAL